MDFNALLLVCFVLAIVVLSLAVRLALKMRKKAKNSSFAAVLKPVYVFIAGFFVSATILFFPLYFATVFNGENVFVNGLKSLIMSAHNTIRLFVIDDDISFVQSALGVEAGVAVVWNWLRIVYSTLFVLYYVVAPLLTATFVLSLVSNINENVKYYLNQRSNVYLFSCLSESSLAVARDAVRLRENGKKALVVFADVDDLDDADEGVELKSRAKKLGAIFFKGDLTSVKLYKGKQALRKVYFISENEEENSSQALKLIERLRGTPLDNARTQIFVFAGGEDSEILLNSADKGKMKVRRINTKRNMVWDVLRTHSVFDDAYEREDGVRVMNVVIAGFGSYALELLKALCWMGQMPNYILNVHVFSKEGDAATRFESACPEIMQYSGVFMEGCPYYNVVFHENVDVFSGEFDKQFLSVGRVTTFFSMLGNDEVNVYCAIKARKLLGREAIAAGFPVPPVFAVVYSDILNKTVGNFGLRSFNGVDYGVELIGEISKRYSIEVIEQRALENLAYRCHRAWGKTRENMQKFKKYEYYRRSSLAQALHAKYSAQIAEKFGVSTDSLEFGDCEHKRWMAYMRSEGYVYGEKKDDIAKTHPSLVPTARLSEEEFEKDFTVIRSRKLK